MTGMLDAGSVSRTVDVLGRPLHYSEMGKDAGGAVVILLHGSGPGASGWSNFKGNISVLAERFHVLAVDMPGWGGSAAGPDQSIDHPQTLLAFMDAMGIERAALVGNSMGGVTATTFAVEHPERVTHLITMGTGSGPSPKIFSPAGGLSEGMKVLVDAYERPTPESMKRLVEVMTFDSERFGTDELARERAETALEHPEHLAGYLHRFRTTGPISRWFQMEDLQALEVPTLLIHGRDDRVMTFEHSLLLLSHIPNARLLLINRCGHWAQVEHTDEFNRVVAEFVLNH